MLIERISQRLLLPSVYIANLAAGASYHYKTYQIPKRNGDLRRIDHPSKPLKAAQRWLAANVIVHFPVHSAAMAYRPRINIAANARLHAASRYLVRIDLHDFFHSLTAADVVELVASSIRFVPNTAGWNEDDTQVFVSLVCKDGHLTIGAPTSPPMCNALCYQLDIQLAALADTKELTYTRYADDLVFSSRAPDQLRDLPEAVGAILTALTLPKGLRINTAKTWHASRRGRRKVTGVVLTSEGKLSLGRSTKRQLRTAVFRWRTLDTVAKKRLAGLLAHVRSVEPEFINSLILKYGADQVMTAMRPES
jgi:RNA-directed DNA polymerase